MTEVLDLEGYGVASIPGTDIQSAWVLVTKELADRFLDKNVENRIIRVTHLHRIKEDMANGRWMITHQGIAFDTRGIMCDGQHRCISISETGVSCWMLITLGLDPLTKRVVDHGSKRKVQDFMNGKYKAVRSSGIRYMLAIENSAGEFTIPSLTWAAKQVSDTAIQDAWDDFDNVEDLSALALEASKNSLALGSAGLLVGALLYPDTALEFLSGIKYMSGLEPGDPRLALLRLRGTGRRIQTPNSVFLSVKAAKAFSEGRKLTVVRQSQTEKFVI